MKKLIAAIFVIFLTAIIAFAETVVLEQFNSVSNDGTINIAIMYDDMTKQILHMKIENNTGLETGQTQRVAYGEIRVDNEVVGYYRGTDSFHLRSILGITAETVTVGNETFDQMPENISYSFTIKSVGQE